MPGSLSLTGEAEELSQRPHAPALVLADQRLELALLVHVAVPLKHPRLSSRDVVFVPGFGFFVFFRPLRALVQRVEHVLRFYPVPGGAPGEVQLLESGLP